VHLTRQTWRKVPEVTVYFWIIKVLTTAMGEATSDYSVHQIDPVIAVALGFVGLVIALLWQLVVRRYIPPCTGWRWSWWLSSAPWPLMSCTSSSAFRIQCLTAGFAIVLAVIFLTWYRVEGTLSIHSIVTLRRELFYWATVLATFALGTAAGDLVAYTFHLGFLGAGLLFAGVGFVAYVWITRVDVAHEGPPRPLRGSA
jgi:uncharacterized membrane-anchored protein